MVTIRKRGDIYYAGWQDSQGIWRKKSLGTKSLKEARQKAASLSAAIEEGSENDRIDQLIEDYRGDMERRGLKESHINDTIQQVEDLVDVAEIYTTSGLTVRGCEIALSYVSHLKGHSQNAYHSALSGFCSWLVNTGRMGINPMRKVKRSKARDSIARREFTDRELSLLCSVVPKDRALLYRIAANTGLRRNELKTLRRDCVNFEKGTVFVRVEKAKSVKSRMIPLTRDIWDEWMTWVDWDENNRLIPAVPSQRTVKKDIERAGLDIENSEGILVFHSLRSTYATNLFRAGNDPGVVQKLMGHASIKTTMKHYAKFNSQDYFDAVRKLQDFQDSKKAKKKRKRGTA